MASGRRTLGIALVLAGLGLLVYAAMQGSLRVGLFLVIPYVYGTGIAPFVGFVLMMAGGFLWLTSRFHAAPPPERGYEYAPEGAAWDGSRPREEAAGARTERRSKHGGFVLLGPIPIVWGSDKRMLPWLLVLGVGLFLLMLVLPMLLAR